MRPVFLPLLAMLLAPAAFAKSPSVVAARVAELADQLAPGLRRDGATRRLAVLTFDESTPGVKRRHLGKTLSEALAVRLSSSGAAELVERAALDKVAAELKLSLSGAVDPATAKSVGKMAAADAVLTGSVAELGDFYDVSVRAVSVEDGKVLAAAVVDIEREAVDGKPSAPASEASLQASIDLLESALMAYARAHIDRFQVSWPKTLDELVPKYLDRLPDAKDGRWVYDPKAGKVAHSAHPELRPSMPRLNIQKFLDQGRKQALMSNLRQIATAMKVYEAQSGARPRSLDDLDMETPDAFGGKWLYDEKTGVVRHSDFPDLTWTP